MKKLFFAAIIILIFLFSGCSDTTSSNDSQPPPEALDIYVPTTSIDDTHPDSYAQSVKFKVETTSLFQLILSSLFEQGELPWKRTGDHWEYTETEDGLTNILRLFEYTDHYEIEWILDGTDGDGTAYDNFTIFTITQAKDGKSGSWAINDIIEGSGHLVASYSWTLDGQGTFSATLNNYDLSGIIDSKMSFTVNADGSGHYDFYEYDVLIESAIWNADGSGSLTDYTTSPPTVHSWEANPSGKTNNKKELRNRRPLSKLLQRAVSISKIG